MFFRTPFFLPLLYKELTWRIPTNEKKIYLTFDDGPVSGPTDFALDQLGKFGAKATFFCIGKNVQKNESLYHRIRQEGHSIGNHTFNHVSGWSIENEKYLDEVKKCQHVIGNTKLFRPPYGRIKRSQLKLLNEFEVVMWDVLSYDYSKSVNPDSCLKGVIRATRTGSIIVFHDSYKAEKNMTYVLPRFLDHYKKKGFVFDSLSEA